MHPLLSGPVFIPSPTVFLSIVCRCPLFSECVGKGLSHPIWDLPRLHESKFKTLSKVTLEIGSLSSAQELTAAQAKHWEAVQAGTWVIDSKGLKTVKSRAKIRVWGLVLRV